ncbi:YciI family protein [Tumebacillus flagellatus]|uniref:YCII-related domain-containing protein n=1 Tax=Tumebacillus flagellatus TaxID=1157490 RepID=A0A074LMY7_9BACL|nr:YciI family protein [Tumebacillus flagellatus]KEO81198.1 hypothetical protein EL26_21930 [Tumebacillus flagellatus]
MIFMLVVKATKDSENGFIPDQAHFDAMRKFNDELKQAGAFIAAQGLHPSSNAIRISYPEPGGKPKVVDGPFTEAKELIAGFTLIEVNSREEAIQWAMRMPDPHGNGEGEIELRQVYGAAEFTQDPEALARETEMLARVKRKLS